MVQDKAGNTKRLARNTLFLYFRSIFCLLVSLYSSRLILQSLGVDDYGINNAVAGFASMFTLVTGSLSSAISRFLTYEQGTGDKQKQRKIFSLSLNLMIGFSIIIILLAETLGIWFVQNKMTIPSGRETAAMWAFQCATLTVVTGLIVSPFNSAILSHEKMDIYAFISILEAVLRLGLAVFLAFGRYTIDRLILYTVIWTICTLFLHVCAITYSAVRFQECRFRLFYEKNLFFELFRYAGWNFVGNVSGTLSGQGVNMLFNVYCGPAVNAARGLSNTVERSIVMFVNNFTLALTPQITKAYAANDMQYVKYLTYRGSRFSFYILFLISLPVLLESQFVFSLWLGDVPEHVVNFNRISLIISLMGLLYTVFGNIQQASGNIRNYSLVLSLINLIQFPLAWVFLKKGFAPEVVYFIAIGITIVNIFAAHHIVSKTMPYSFQELMKEIYLPELKVIFCSASIPILAIILLPYGWWRFLITGALCVLFTIPSILFLGCSEAERGFIINIIRNKVSSFFLRSK